MQDAILNRFISERHARALIGLKGNHEAQEVILEQIIAEQLNVKQTEERVQQFLYPDLEEKDEPKKKKKQPVNRIQKICGLR